MTEKKPPGQSDTKGRSTLSLYLVCGSLMIFILLLDLSTPLGVAISVSYVVVVLVSLWSPQKRFTIFIGVACTLLAIGVFFFKPAVDEMWKVILNRALALFAIWVTVWLGLQRKILEEKREQALRERERALEDVRVLRGLLPICASCKKIRENGGYWTEIEWYIKNHSEADFSHGVCPECAKRLYPDFYKEKNDPDKGTQSLR